MSIILLSKTRKPLTIAFIVEELERDLKDLTRKHLAGTSPRLIAGTLEPSEVYVGLTEITRLRRALAAIRELDRDAAFRGLERWREELTHVAAQTSRRRHASARLPLARSLVLLESAIDRLATSSTDGQSPAYEVLFPSVILTSLCTQLMPPERMAVVAGTSVGRQTTATGVFDVTAMEAAGRCHVRADSRKLAEALLGMETTGTTLLAWVHSHPGSGKPATFPSPIDQTQYADWIRDYPQLLAAIVTADRFVRFFGDAVEKKDIEVRIEGPGSTKVDEHVHRLA